MFFKRLLMFLVLCTSSFAFAAPYEHFIASISEDGSKITLDNGFTWEVIVPLLTFGDDREIVKQWSAGDEVAMRINTIDGEGRPRINFHLKNLRTLTTVWVGYREQTMEWMAHTIENIDSKGNVTLSDGSRWEIWRTGATDYWKQGERVLVYRYKRYINYYVLVNPDYGLQKSRWYHTYHLSGVYSTLLN